MQYYCTQTLFEAKFHILMCPSNHRNVLVWFYNPEMSPFALHLCELSEYNHWVNRRNISFSSWLRWLHLLTAKQNDIQNKN